MPNGVFNEMGGKDDEVRNERRNSRDFTILQASHARLRLNCRENTNLYKIRVFYTNVTGR